MGNLSSPRTWGCFPSSRFPTEPLPALPTHVGVFLIFDSKPDKSVRLPHARGGVSVAGYFKSCPLVSSPRTWGCFLPVVGRGYGGRVFPTHVGVFPDPAKYTQLMTSLPHARGGVSAVVNQVMDDTVSSPRTWGCFPLPVADMSAGKVFPTHVGVFPHRL